MKAKISYTVEIGSIPNEVNKLLEPEMEKLRICASDSFYDIKNSNLDLSLVRLDSLRKNLLDIDTRIMECYSILQGYKKAIDGGTDKESKVEENNGELSE